MSELEIILSAALVLYALLLFVTLLGWKRSLDKWKKNSERQRLLFYKAIEGWEKAMKEEKV
jgi:hypothetical protein